MIEHHEYGGLLTTVNIGLYSSPICSQATYYFDSKGG